MLFAACKDDPPPPNPPSFGSESTAVTLPAVSLTNSGAAIYLSTGVTADNLAWSCKTYTQATGVTTAYAPGEVTALINNAATKNASVTVKKAGTYIFELTASNTGSTAVTKTVTVVVNGYQRTKTVTKDVDVTFALFDEEPTVIDLNPTYTPTGGWGTNFSEGNIRFEIKDDRGNDNSKFPDGILDRNKASELYGGSTLWPWAPPLFTQTFYDNDDNELGEYSFFAGDRFADGYFGYIREDTNSNGVYDAADQAITSLPPPNASPLTLTLSKDVTAMISEVE
jgi:hypothetical protein